MRLAWTFVAVAALTACGLEVTGAAPLSNDAGTAVMDAAVADAAPARIVDATVDVAPPPPPPPLLSCTSYSACTVKDTACCYNPKTGASSCTSITTCFNDGNMFLCTLGVDDCADGTCKSFDKAPSSKVGSCQK